MKIKLVFFCVLIFPFFVKSQEKLNNLKTPTSPASSILGLQPTAVLSPKSYQALEASIYSNFLDNNKPVIPNDFALEFTPYWATNNRLSLEEYLFPKNGFDQFIRSSSFSIASTQNFVLGDSTATNGLAFGYRATFYFGNKKDREILQGFETISDRSKRIYNEIGLAAEKLADSVLVSGSKIKNKDDFLVAIRGAVFKAFRMYESIEKANEFVTKIISDTETLIELDTNDPDIFVAKLKDIVDLNLKGNLIFNEYKSYIKARQGFSLDVAYASFLNFPTNNFEFSIVPRQSVWVTPTYRFKNKLNFLKVMGVLRYEWYSTAYYREYFPDIDIYENNTDYGFAISTEFNNFSFQFEIVGRNSNSEIPAGLDVNGNELFRKERKSDFQYIGSFNYNISDQIILTYSIGNRFEPILNPKNTLVSMLSLNFGFGTPTEDNLK